ncbi:MAG: hypothetical protein ACK5Z5_01590 [Neisseriaceae bacterium]
MDIEKTIALIRNNFLENLVFQGATYASINIVTDKNICLYVSTNNYWNDLYHDNNFSSHCHLISAASTIIKQKNDFTLLWDTVLPNTEMSNIIDGHRIRNKLCHGVSFIQKDASGIIQSINLASSYGNLMFAKSVIENKEKIFNELRKITQIKKL